MSKKILNEAEEGGGSSHFKKKMYEIFLYAYCLSSNLDNKKKKTGFYMLIFEAVKPLLEFPKYQEPKSDST